MMLMQNYDSDLGDFLLNIIAKCTTNGINPQIRKICRMTPTKVQTKDIEKSFEYEGIHDRYSAYQKIYHKSLGTT